MNISEAKEIEKKIKLFWNNYEIISRKAAEKNAANGNNYAWQYYANCSGSVANYSIFPEITNCELVAFLTKDKKSKLYPDEDIIKDFRFILLYTIR